MKFRFSDWSWESWINIYLYMDLKKLLRAVIDINTVATVPKNVFNPSWWSNIIANASSWFFYDAYKMLIYADENVTKAFIGFIFIFMLDLQ